MGEPAPPPVGFAELRKKFSETFNIEPAKFLALIEAPADYVYTYPLEKHGVVRFRRWSQEQVNRFGYLPFVLKLGKEDLTAEEEAKFEEFQILLVKEALQDPGKWMKELTDHEFVDTLFTMISYVSGLHREFDRQLDAFLKTEDGFLYGQLWFLLFKKTPSEIAKLPHSDVKTVNAWLAAYASRVNPSG